MKTVSVPRTREIVPPLFLLGCMRSGKTVLRKLLATIDASIVSLSDDDSECRTFWQAFGLRIGARATGSLCLAAGRNDVRTQDHEKIVAHLEKRCANGERVVNDNAHLMNKIGYVAEVLPTSQFVLVLRDAGGLISHAKQGFLRGNTSNESYPPFVHYWPDVELPCWYTIRNDCSRCLPTIGTARRTVRELCYRLRVKERTPYAEPSCVFPHETLSTFRQKFPDASRYYPGAGFARLPEAWLTMNVNALRQLQLLKSTRWMTISFSDLIHNTQRVVRAVAEFAGMDTRHIADTPIQMDRFPLGDPKVMLTSQERETVRRVLQERCSAAAALCDLVGEDLLVH